MVRGASVCVCTRSSLSFCPLHAKAPTLSTLFFLLLSLSLSLLGQPKKTKNPTAFVIIVPALQYVGYRPRTGAFTEIMDPQVGAQEGPNSRKAPVDGILHGVKFRHRFSLFF